MPFAAIGGALGISAGAAALGTVGLIGAGAGIYDATQASGAATSAANTQANAANNSTGLAESIYNQNSANLSPFLQAGTNTLPILLQQLGIGPGGTYNPNAPLAQPFTAQQYQQSPGYAFQMQQGTNAVLNNASALGGVNSGNTLKALTQYGQGLANTDYQQAYNNYVNQQNTTFGQLSNIAGIGQNAAVQQGSVGNTLTNNVSANTAAAANATSAGTVANANINNNLINSLIYGNGSGGTSGGSGGIGSSLSSLYSSIFGPGAGAIGAGPAGAGAAAPASYFT